MTTRPSALVVTPRQCCSGRSVFQKLMSVALKSASSGAKSGWASGGNGVGVGVGLGVGVIVGVAVVVGVGVLVGIAVGGGPIVGVAVGVDVGVLVGIAVGVGVGVIVGVVVGVTVGVCVCVAVGVTVGVGDGVVVGVDVCTAVGVTMRTMTTGVALGSGFGVYVGSGVQVGSGVHVGALVGCVAGVQAATVARAKADVAAIRAANLYMGFAVRLVIVVCSFWLVRVKSVSRYDKMCLTGLDVAMADGVTRHRYGATATGCYLLWVVLDKGTFDCNVLCRGRRSRRR